VAEWRGWTTWDWVVPAVLAALVVVEVLSFRPEGWPLALVLLLASCAALVGRRRWPLPSCVAAGVLGLGVPWAGPELNDVASPIFILVLVSWSLARWLPGHARGLLGLTAAVGVLVLDYVFTDERDNNVTDVVFAASLLVPPYVFGKISRRLDEQTRLVARQAEQIRAQAVREERHRIARELHDVIAHSVSAMVVQTAAAQDLLRTDPDHAGTLLEHVAQSGRAALAETGRLLHVVRDEDDELGLRPAPGLADLPELVSAFRSAGLEVETSLVLPERSDAGADVSAYRVVQEALTNASRYGVGPARLEVAATGDHVRISCSNRVGDRPAGGSGLGLLGMAERVGLLGGSLRHGVVGDRFEVTAEIPIAGGATS
jgi:signal transduction histidine kinase